MGNPGTFSAISSKGDSFVISYSLYCKPKLSEKRSTLKGKNLLLLCREMKNICKKKIHFPHPLQSLSRAILCFYKKTMDQYQTANVQADLCLVYSQFQIKHFFQPKSIDIFFLIFFKNICCGCLLEVPLWGTSNKYSQHMILWRYKKNIFLWIQLLSGTLSSWWLIFTWQSIVREIILTILYEGKIFKLSNARGVFSLRRKCSS